MKTQLLKNRLPKSMLPEIRFPKSPFLGTGLAALALFLGGDLVADELRAGFSEIDITPDLDQGPPVWIAGFAPGRRATGVHDPLMARCMVLVHDRVKIALLSVDLIGLQRPQVIEVREKLTDFRYVVVSSTHNHEGPDVIGLWGETWWKRGVDDTYLTTVVGRLVKAVREAEGRLIAVRAEYGTAADDSLLGDSREPFVKDGVLRTLRFVRVEDLATAGILVQWSCHPESLGSRNQQLTADFPAFTVAQLKETHRCPVVYFSGAVGGLMSNPSERIRADDGEWLPDGNFEYALRYGKEVAGLATKAIRAAEPVKLTPFVVASRAVVLPIENQVYRAGQEIGVLRRPALAWTGDAEQPGTDAPNVAAETANAVETEVAYVRFGEVHVACIPGELYPELVYGKVQDPADAGADFPTAPIEPSVCDILPGPKWLLLGLANDEIGYIIPRRQWDEKPPYCYGRTRAQYGEINSCGPSVAPIIMRALANRVSEAAR